MSEPTRIVAIRHGETDWNSQSRLQGHTDIPLNAMGLAQAATLAEALRHEGLTHVYSSDLGRAAQTARALAGPLSLPVTTDVGLRERGFGLMEGLSYRELDETRPEWAAHWRARVPDFTPPEGESLITLHARVLAVAKRLAAAHRGGCIALVSHGGVLDSLYRAATGLALDAPRSWQLGNAAINRLLFTGEGFTLVGWNDRQHLELPAQAPPDR
ncbi:MAG: histidine phosphatase family protein [Ideonella sp.]|nr:histidine phosphatase family protein [Ideonella sp.]